MQIKDLTLQDIKNICRSKGRCSKKCPLYEHTWCCMGLKNMTKREMESEINYEKKS